MENIKNTNLIPPSPEIDINTLKPFTRFCCSIGIIPASYLVAMSYEEQLLWLCDFLENTVIPTINNNGEAVTELQGLFIQLKTYVDNYFKNLDVQDEINNKLDEMAESGQLEAIIINYLQKISISYEQFGAVGDGITDDFISIKNAHDYANAHNLKIIAQSEKTYLIKNATSSIEIKTDVDWNNCNFIIDDTDNPNNIPIFITIPNNPIQNISSAITSLSKNQKQCALTGYGNALIAVENASKKDYIRKGSNQDNGSSRTDIFRIDNDGNILDDILWNFNAITKITLYPIDDNHISITNGNFVTKVNSNQSEDYLRRNIRINRSNVEINNITHTLQGENTLENSSPYDGFIQTYYASNIIIKNCNLSGHKTFYNSSNVAMGSYDLYNMASIDVTMDNIQQINSITNTNLWGIHTSNYSKNIKLLNSSISRFDAHKGIHNFEIDNCNLGHQAIRFVGSGLGIINNTVVNNNLAFIILREDYGATFDGKLIINDCKLISLMPQADIRYIVQCRNDETWDFGYKCYVPELYIQNFQTYISEQSQTCCVLGFRTHTSKVNFEASYDENVKNGVFPYIFTNNIHLKDLLIFNNENAVYDIIHYVDPMTLYVENVGTSLNKYPNSSNNFKNGNITTNVIINADNCQFSNFDKVNSTFSQNACSLWSATGINLSTFNFENTHRPIMHIILKNLDFLRLGISGRPALYEIFNCNIYQIRNFDSSNTCCFNYFILFNSNLMYHYTGEINNANRLFNGYDNCYELYNCNFNFEDSSQFAQLAQNEFPFRIFGSYNSTFKMMNIINNCSYLNVTDDNLKSVSLFSILMGRAGFTFEQCKNHDDIYNIAVCGYSNQIPAYPNDNNIEIPNGYLFFNKSTNSMMHYDGTQFVNL